MAVILEHLASAVVIGIGATALMDIWGALREPLLGWPRLDYALVGRWFGHMAAGRFRHDAIKGSPAIRGEVLIGWVVHYLIGISFAALLIGVWGIGWVVHPTIGPAMAVGIGTIAGPWLVMQPGMGAGIAGSRTPNPTAARLQSLISHSVFGIGLYHAALVLNLFRAS